MYLCVSACLYAYIGTGFLGSQKRAEGIRSHEAGGDYEPLNINAENSGPKNTK